jgi:hypothetical protein
MSSRLITSIAAVTALATAFISTDASAWRAAGGVRAGGVYRGGVYRGGAYRGAYVRRGVGVGVGVGLGAAAVGAAVAAPYYYGRPACGYYPYPPCY